MKEKDIVSLLVYDWFNIPFLFVFNKIADDFL